MTQRNVERMLTEQPTPTPPEGLAERIKAEIPDRLEVSEEITGTPTVVAMPRRRQWQLAAAAVVVLALTATVTWQIRKTGPEMPLHAQVGGKDQVSSAPVDTPEPMIDSPAALPGKLEEVTSGESGAIDDEIHPPAEHAPARSTTEPVSTRDKSDEGRRPQAPVKETDEHLPRTAEFAGREPVRQIAELADKEKRSRLNEKKLESRVDPHDIAGRIAADAVSVTSEPAATGVPSPSQLAARKVGYAEQQSAPPPSTGGTTEPNDQPYGDVFFRSYGVNPFIDTEDDNLSTFGLDVDTGSYTVARRYLRDGHLPPPEAVRVEEFLNSFDYGDDPPRRGDFGLAAEGAPAPFAEGDRYYLLRFAITAREVAERDRPPATLVFVVDISGSMNRENRLGLVKKALYELLEQLRKDDRVGLVVYGSRGEVLLEPTTDHEAIRSAIGRLRASGSTNAEEGLVLAYKVADRLHDEEGINRVILCSDGVANVGRTGPESILGRIARYADRGIELTTVGFGMGNYNDVLMERLADTGNGRYAYVDALPEARRIFVEELTGTLMTIGFDSKAQVEFNPDIVSRYRLLGYENRDIADERFRDPTVDAGEIGAGHRVTALYEIKLHSGLGKSSRSATAATLRLRYRPVDSDEAVELEESILLRELANSWDVAAPSLKLATLVAEYAEILKASYWAKDGDLNEVLRRAQQLSPEFAGDARVADFVSLVAAAARLSEASSAAADEGIQD